MGSEYSIYSWSRLDSTDLELREEGFRELVIDVGLGYGGPELVVELCGALASHVLRDVELFEFLCGRVDEQLTLGGGRGRRRRGRELVGRVWPRTLGRVGCAGVQIGLLVWYTLVTAVQSVRSKSRR